MGKKNCSRFFEFIFAFYSYRNCVHHTLERFFENEHTFEKKTSIIHSMTIKSCEDAGYRKLTFAFVNNSTPDAHLRWEDIIFLNNFFIYSLKYKYLSSLHMFTSTGYFTKQFNKNKSFEELVFFFAFRKLRSNFFLHPIIS